MTSFARTPPAPSFNTGLAPEPDRAGKPAGRGMTPKEPCPARQLIERNAQ